MVRALAIDVGSTSVRAAVVEESGRLTHVERVALEVRTPRTGEVEYDGDALVERALGAARRTLERAGPCDAVGVSTQRATTVLFDASTGRAVGPALSWQDLRTVIDCLVLQGDGLRLAPNQTATKARWLLEHAPAPRGEWRIATMDTWLAWHLTGGTVLVTDRTNASVTGLTTLAVDDWDRGVLELLDLDRSLFAQLVDCVGPLGEATALPGAPPLTALVGDQPASLFGQGCVGRGAKLTVGTGAILDAYGPLAPPTAAHRRPSGTYPTVLFSDRGVVSWGLEGIALSAGACVDWLVELGLAANAPEADRLGASVADTRGAAFVPALSGLGTPWWDFGARGAFTGLTRGVGRAHLVRAVLDGIAQRGADLVEAMVADGVDLTELRVDGGVSDSPVVMRALADLTGLVIAVGDEREATARGAGLMALVGAGLIDLDAVRSSWTPRAVVEPAIGSAAREAQRSQWREQVTRARGAVPELSEIDF